MPFDYDLFVIGAGSGGTRAARIASLHGAKVAIAEEFRIGGTCVIRGCVPKKILVYASRFADAFADSAAFGWSVGEPQFDWPTLRTAKEKEITRLSGAYAANLDRAKVETFRQRATVAGPQEIALADGRRLAARHILIATGGHPVLQPRVEGIEHTITSNEIFDLPAFPRRLLVIGGGYIAVEFACLFRRLGAEVVQTMRADNILRGFDDDMRAGLRDEMTRAGVQFRFGRLPIDIRVEGSTKRVTLSDGEALEVDQILLAIGRKPNTRGLGLETAGVRVAESGAVMRQCAFDHKHSVDSRDRRCHRPHPTDAGGDPRGPLARRPAVRRRNARSQLRGHSQRRVHHAGDRRGRAHRDAGARPLSKRSTSTRPASGR